MSENVISLSDATIYQKNHLVLSDVNFDIAQGDFYYLIGKTGSGKSSLLKILYGDLPLRSGQGSVVGMDLTHLRPKDIPALRRHLGIVFQDFQLLTDRNVDKNLEFVLRATGWNDKVLIHDRIDEVLDSVGMLTKKYKMPYQLSGGEQQRIAIARALLNHPQLILADEPTGNLDPETSNEIMNVLLQVSRKNNCSVLMATHDYVLIKNFPNRTLICANGTVEKAESEALFA